MSLTVLGASGGLGGRTGSTYLHVGDAASARVAGATLSAKPIRLFMLGRN